MAQLTERDKLPGKEIVALRAEVFKMAVAEATGKVPKVWLRGGSDFEWAMTGWPAEVEYRACVLADMAHPFHAKGPVCFPCWEYHDYDGADASRSCDRVTNLEALRFTPCWNARSRGEAPNA